MIDLCIQDSKKGVRHGIWKLRVHTFQHQNLLSDQLSILKWFRLISVPNEFIYHFYGTFFIMSDLDMTRVFLKAFDSYLEALTPYFHLSKPIKWSLNYIKWLLSIEILTFRDFGVISWVTSYWDILKWDLSDHLIRLLK